MNAIHILLNQRSMFWAICFVVSCYYGIRGLLIQRHKISDENIQREKKQLKPWGKIERIFVHDIQDIIFNFICSLGGFTSLYLEVKIFSKIADTHSISTGTAIFLIFLSLFAVTGISGTLPQILLYGKLFRSNV